MKVHVRTVVVTLAGAVGLGAVLVPQLTTSASPAPVVDVATAGDSLAPQQLIGAVAAVSSPRTNQVTPQSPQSDIRALQFLLNAHGIATTVDGSFGPQTQANVKTFQRKRGLAVDGQPGPQTMRAIVSPIQYGVTGNRVRAAQRLLNKHGISVAVDGSFGPATRTAVRTFQARKNLQVDGAVGPVTWSYLFEAASGGGGTPPQPPTGNPTFNHDFMVRREDRMGIAWPLTPMQADNAKFIIAVGKGNNMSPKAIKTALATAIVESWLYNRYRITDADSGGLFQQRPVSGWGSYSQVRNKLQATKAFYGVASHTRNPGVADYYPAYLNWSIGKLAQTVQRSAYPDRYQQWAWMAERAYEQWKDIAPYRG